MRQRVKPWTRWHGGILVPSMSGVGLVESGGGEPGDLVHGELATIEGSGFGAVASPVRLYDDFSTGTLNALVRSTAASGVGTWETGAGDNVVYRSNSVSRGVHSRNAYHNNRSSGGSFTGALCMNEDFRGDWFLDWWRRVDRAPGNATPGGTRNYKTFRFYDNTGNGDGFALTHLGPLSGGSVMFFTPPSNANYVSAPFSEQEWVHFQLRFRVGTTYSTDVMHMAQARAGQSFSTIYSGGWRSAGQTMYPAEMRIGNYWAHDSGDGYAANSGADIYTSSFYLANTWARVELGNHAAYASATIREIQQTLSRSNTEIEYRVNRGALSSGVVYEYVFDASNNLVKTTEKTLS